MNLDLHVTLRCRFCKRTMQYARATDPDIPNNVALIENCCDRCDDGDFHDETYFDASGKVVAPE